MYFLDYLKDSSRLEAKNCMYRILMAGKYHNVGYFKYWLWRPFNNAYHARPLKSKMNWLTREAILYYNYLQKVLYTFYY